MGVVALIVLAAIWAAFLLPPIFRARAENRPSGSISDFRRQLRVLARTSPTKAMYAPRPTFPAMAPASPTSLATAVARPGGPSPSRQRTARNRQSIKRRRDVLMGLIVAMVGSLVLGFLPPLRALWAVHVVVDVLFAAYVTLLVYLRNLAAERDVKVRFLPRAPVTAEPALVYSARRSAN